MMKRKRAIAFLVAAGLVVVGAGFAVVSADLDDPRPAGKPTPAPSGDTWIDLLSDENAAHWKNVTDGREDIFSIEDGVFHIGGRKPTRYIAFEKESFGDFQLHVEFKVSKGANSGVFFRTNPKNPVYGGMEIQVLDDHGEQPTRYGCGALYDIATPMFNLARPTGEWNSYDITCRGSQLVVELNGWKVLDLDLATLDEPIGKFPTPLAELPQEGHVILQDHGDEVWYRNVLVKPL